MYKNFVRPLLNKFDHEDTKGKTIDIIHSLETNPIGLALLEKFAYKGKRFTHPKLQTTVAGISFDNPILLGAGWDKEARAVKGLHRLGFGGIEIGTVTAYPQPGNPRPRLHLLDDDVALNHFGFNGPGMEVVAQNLKRYKNSKIPIGINIAKNKYVTPLGAAPLYAVVVRRLYELGSYFVINVSSPNTIGLKVLQGKKFLEEIVKETLSMMDDIGERKPLFIKIAPDISYKDLDGVIEITRENSLAGIIAVNTFPHANSLAKYGQLWEDRQGGLSGNDKHYRTTGTRYLAYIHEQTDGKITTIGVGGVYNTQTALEKIAAGATLVQTFTGLLSEGPSLPGKITRGIVDYMEKEKIRNLEEIRGVDAKIILQNKNSYSFTINNSQNSLENLKKEYLSAVFQRNDVDTLLISNNPFKLKHGELGRTWSHIYLNHRTPLFNQQEYKNLFAKLLDALIKEKILTNGKNQYGVLTLPTSSSPELTSLLQNIYKEKIDKAAVLSDAVLREEKGAHSILYGKIDNDKQWVMIDDVFTSGKTVKETINKLKKTNNLPQEIVNVSLVMRNENIVTSFKKQTMISTEYALSLDEILQYHWSKFSRSEKKIIQKERIALN